MTGTVNQYNKNRFKLQSNYTNHHWMGTSNFLSHKYIITKWNSQKYLMFYMISLTFLFQITVNTHTHTNSSWKFCWIRAIYLHKQTYSTKTTLHVNTLQNLWKNLTLFLSVSTKKSHQHTTIIWPLFHYECTFHTLSECPSSPVVSALLRTCTIPLKYSLVSLRNIIMRHKWIRHI